MASALAEAERILDPEFLLQLKNGLGGAQTPTLLHIILNRVCGDSELQQQFRGAAIRLAAVQADVISSIYEILQKPPEIQNMTIGDVTLPEELRPVICGILQRGPLVSDGETRYDLQGLGADEGRRNFIAILHRDYGFPEELLLQLSKNTTLTNGGMRALDTIAEARVLSSLRADKKHRFISPDSSYPTYLSIIADAARDGRDSELHQVPTKQCDLLHLSPEGVRDFYRRNPTDRNITEDTWNITPVGNPSSTTISPECLTEVCEAILEGNPKAIIIMDCAYVRTLPRDDSKALMACLFQHDAIIKQVIFVDSFSKTHGLCRERIGGFFSMNAAILGPIRTIYMKHTAGPGAYLDRHLEALVSQTDDETTAIREGLHERWAKKRRDLYNALVTSGRYADLFHPDQSHNTQDQLAKPNGLYLFLRLQDGVTVQQVALKTKCFGVPVNLNSGSYVRFSMGIEA